MAGAVAVLCCVLGCGGGGHSKKKFAGTYSGPFLVSRRGTMPPDFNPPSGGTATATVTRSGALTVDFGDSYLLTAQLVESGSATSGAITYPSTTGPKTFPALVGWGEDDGQRKVSAFIEFDFPSGSAVFAAQLTRDPSN